MWHTYYAPGTLDEALGLLAQHGDACRIMAGGTDLILELERGVRQQQIIVDISRIPGLDQITRQEDMLALGPAVTHNQVAGSPETVADAFPLARACWLVGAPQIRNRGTIAGNVVTASPANDTITPLWAMDARLVLVSQARGPRTLSCAEFFQGVRRTALAPDEMVVRIEVPALGPHSRGTFLKFGLRQAQAISVVNVAVVLDFEPDQPQVIQRARIALGSVAPTIVRAGEAETYLAGKELTADVIAHAATLAVDDARPISDVRASADFRRSLVRVLVSRALQQLRDGSERSDWPAQPPMLWGATDGHFRANGQQALRFGPDENRPLRLTVNGQSLTLPHARGKTLLRALREDAGLTGTKEGCAEGECGACTVWLDGIAVMSCLVPAERAEGCQVVTVEGVNGDRALHPVQEAFIAEGAVQCGYCTPGFVMSAANLLAELPEPSREQVQLALTGNLCRCTGYYKILSAVERAAVGSAGDDGTTGL